MTTREVLIFLPGIVGSVLQDGQDVVWPGDGWEAVVGFSDARFEQLLKPTLKATDVIRSAVGGLVPIYAPWIKIFESLRRDGKQLFSEAEGTLVLAYYDWRKSCRDAAAILAEKVEEVFKTFGPDCSINIAAHSFGGLIARYYLQSGHFDVETYLGIAAVKKVICFAVPHNGTALALSAAVGGYSAIFLSAKQTRSLANDPGYPALYEIFPQPDAPAIWLSEPSDDLTPKTLRDKNFAISRLGLTEEGYQAYLSFRDAIDGKPLNTLTPRWFLFVGNHHQTTSNLLFGDGQLIGNAPPDAGDGTVSLDGAIVGDCQIQFCNEAHVTIIYATGVQSRLADLLGATLAIERREAARLSVKSLAVSRNEPIEFVFTNYGPHPVSGRIAIEPAPAQPPQYFAEAQKIRDVVPPIEWKSLGRGSVSFTVAPIEVPGVYKAVLVDDQGRGRVGSEYFVVRKET
jgi:hypothetical protein